MSHRCVCYTCDHGYLLATLASAVQARRNVAAEACDVLLLLFADPREDAEWVAAICREERIVLQVVDPDVLGGAPLVIARLILDDLLPPQYEQLLYVDGDTQIKGDLSPLVTTDMADDEFLACDDPLAFTLTYDTPRGRTNRAHLASLGLPIEDGYFNAGVLRMNRSGWKRVEREALDTYRSSDGRYRYNDQDALNIVGKGRRRRMSLAWNFPVFMLNARVADRINPVIYHFMAHPKPWLGSFPPWGDASYGPYLDLMARHPGLRRLWRPTSPAQRLRYAALQHYRRARELAVWGLGSRRSLILSYEAGLPPLPG